MACPQCGRALVWLPVRSTVCCPCGLAFDYDVDADGQGYLFFRIADDDEEAVTVWAAEAREDAGR